MNARIGVSASGRSIDGRHRSRVRVGLAFLGIMLALALSLVGVTGAEHLTPARPAVPLGGAPSILRALGSIPSAAPTKLPTTGGLSVLVYDNSTGLPISSAAVALTGGPSGQSLTTKYTGGSGSVFFSGLKAGYYTLEVSASSHRPITPPVVQVAAAQNASVFALLAPGSTTSAPLLAWLSPGSSEVAVGKSVPLLGTPFGGGSGTLSWTWYVGSSSLSTGQSPEYKFTPSSAGSYTVYAVVSQGGSTYTTLGVTVHATSAKLPKTGGIAVYVYDNATGLPISGASVALTGGAPGQSLTSGSTGSSGGAFFSGLAAGYYTLEVSASGYTPVVPPVVQVVAAQNSSLLVLLASGSTTAPPLVAYLSPGSSQIALGKSVTLLGIPLGGGSGALSWTWHVGSSSLSTGQSPEYKFTPSSAGSYTIYAVVSQGGSTYTTLSVTVTA